MIFSNRPIKNTFLFLIFASLTLTLSYFTYFKNYTKPINPFWDENFHICLAQKYIDGVMFMEPHPPLGKMLIAFGEIIFKSNQSVEKSAFLETDHLSEFPENLSFRGYRFFPVLAGWLSALLIFLIILHFCRNYLLSFLMSSLYIFDNALIVHFRGAVLDGIQIFFILLAICYYLYFIVGKDHTKIVHVTILAMITGLAISIKLTSCILILLFPMILLYRIQSIRDGKVDIFKSLKFWSKAIRLSFIYFVVILFVFITPYYIHCRLGTKIVGNRYYQASSIYKKILDENNTKSISAFPIMLKDNLHYIKSYQKSVPSLKYYDESENGNGERIRIC